MSLRVGVIGAGKWGTKILNTLLRLPEASISWVMTNQRLKSFKTLKVGAHAWGDVEAVIIASPASTHLHYIMQAINRGLHVFVEKPITGALRDVDEISQHILRQDFQQVLLCNHIQLFNPLISTAQNLMHQFGGFSSLGAVHQNDGPYRSDCLPIWDYGSHDIALALYLSGYPYTYGWARVVDVNSTGLIKRGSGYAEIADIQLNLAGYGTANLIVGNGANGRQCTYGIATRDGANIQVDDVAKTVMYRETDYRPWVRVQTDTVSPLAEALRSFIRASLGLVDISSDYRFGLALPVDVVTLLHDVDMVLEAKGIFRTGQ